MSMPMTSVIGDEARILSRLSDDVDNFRRFYSMVEDHESESFLVRFVAPQITMFENYRFYLYQNSVTKELSPSRYYRPDYVSYDEYGTPNLWALLLFINEIPTIEDFSMEKILIPTRTAVMTMASEISQMQFSKQLVQLKDLPLKPTPPLYSSKKVIPNVSINVPKADIITAYDIYSNRESITINIVNLRQRYIDLEFEPIEASVNLIIKDKPSYIYGKHYLIIRGNKGYNRLTWDPKNIPNGVGLVGTMIENLSIEVSYSRKIKS